MNSMPVENKPMTIGYRLKLVRESLGLKPDDFASSLGATTLTLTKWEKNESVPRNNVVQLLVNNYKVNRKWIEFGSGEMFEENRIINNENLFDSSDEQNFKNTRPYDYAMEQGCGDAASSFFAAFCNMNAQQKKIVVDSFKAVANVFNEAQNSNVDANVAEIALNKDSVNITEQKVESLFDEQEEQQKEEEKKPEQKPEPPQKKKRQSPQVGRVLALKAKRGL